MQLRTKIFINKFKNNENVFWDKVVSELEQRGFEIHTETSDCDVAILLNALMMNPSVYKDQYGFVITMPEGQTGDNIYWSNLMASILDRYFGNGRLINCYRMSVNQTADKVEKYYHLTSNQEN